MGIADDINKVNGEIREIFDRRRAAVYAKSLQYAAKALNYFRQQQANNKYWDNRTGTARDTMFAKAAFDDGDIVWFMSHWVQYGIYLELANDGKHESIRPVINKYAPQFEKEIRELY